jgi:SAM-dependent methyltransferase
MCIRSTSQKIKDFLTFPLRAFILIDKDRWGFSSLDTERFDYITREVIGYCLDVGCGKYNRLITRCLNKNGIGIDVFRYDGLTDENIIKDISHFPFDNQSFNSVTFSAVISHIPKSLRDIELAEAYRCLKPGGNIIITEGNPLAQILIHKVVMVYDRFLGTKLDVDSERGMHEEEDYYLTDTEIVGRLKKSGFVEIEKKYFMTQWGMNHLFVAWKKQ